MQRITFFAAILRALGNSRSPLIAMIVAAFINVGLDLLFVAVIWLGCTGSSDCHGDRTGVFSSVLSVGPAAHSGCASDKRRFSSAAGDESAGF